MSDQNFLEETIQELQEHNKTTEDVCWCGNEKFGYFNWNDFIEVANFEYYSGYGRAEIANDLMIVGKDFWLERHEYDGSEWWEFKSMPQQPKNYRIPISITQEQAEAYGFDPVEYNIWENTLEALNLGFKRIGEKDKC